MYTLLHDVVFRLVGVLRLLGVLLAETLFCRLLDVTDPLVDQLDIGQLRLLGVIWLLGVYKVDQQKDPYRRVGEDHRHDHYYRGNVGSRRREEDQRDRNYDGIQ